MIAFGPHPAPGFTAAMAGTYGAPQVDCAIVSTDAVRWKMDGFLASAGESNADIPNRMVKQVGKSKC